MKRRVVIDPRSGFCFGVSRAVEMAEEHLNHSNELSSYGEIVHNQSEVERLQKKGLRVVDSLEFSKPQHRVILFRAHGEPPQSYEKAHAAGFKIVDATCPVVLKLQQRFRKAYEELQKINGQLLLFGKKGHPEVMGLMGQVGNDAVLIESVADLVKIDYTRPVELFSQTTMDIPQFNKLVSIVLSRITHTSAFKYHDTICRQVSNRVPWVSEFATRHDVIVFVGGANSSNAKVLYHACLDQNKKSFFVTSEADIDNDWFEGATSVGICGATSTPMWQLEKVRQAIESLE